MGNYMARWLLLLLFALLPAACDSGNEPEGSSAKSEPAGRQEARQGGLPAGTAGADASAGETGAPKAAAIADGPRTLVWEELIPPDWRPDDLFAEYDNLDQVQDNDAMALELLEKLRRVWAEAPVVAALDGQWVKLPGFAVPLDFEAKKVREFLLVPYFGACIHAPPPPANQTVYVKVEPGRERKIGLYDTVWVSGILSAKRFKSELAEAGYTLQAREIEPYVDPELTVK